MYLLIPGRHHLLTRFQLDYIRSILQQESGITAIDGKQLLLTSPVEALIFPVTSSNHTHTRRNPLPFYLRALAIESSFKEMKIPVYIYGIDDIGNQPDFAAYTLKRIRHESENKLVCTPENTLVMCSTPVLNLYASLGFRILPAELSNREKWAYNQSMPWDIVEYIAKCPDWSSDPFINDRMSTASKEIWSRYGYFEKVQQLFSDSMISSDGDLTTTRDYNVYVRQMDEIAALKYNETAPFIRAGRIGDIGCAVGSWIRLAAADERFRESDFYGIEVSRHLFEICRQRKENGEFNNPFVFFSQKNAVTGHVFEPGSMHTIHTSSLTHEIESYGGRTELVQFIHNRYEELTHQGVWVNRDVVAPFHKEQEVYLQLTSEDGSNEDPFSEFDKSHELSVFLQGLSTRARFRRFSRDFRATEGFVLPYTEIFYQGEHYFKTTMQYAAEFLSRKDYTDNWLSEMNETFCYWDFEEWKQALTTAGFRIDPASCAYTNTWITENRWKTKATIFSLQGIDLIELPYPVTHMLLLAVKD